MLRNSDLGMRARSGATSEVHPSLLNILCSDRMCALEVVQAAVLGCISGMLTHPWLLELQDAHEQAAAGGDHWPLLKGDAYRRDPQDLAAHVGEHGTCVLNARPRRRTTVTGAGNCARCVGHEGSGWRVACSVVNRDVIDMEDSEPRMELPKSMINLFVELHHVTNLALHCLACLHPFAVWYASGSSDSVDEPHNQCRSPDMGSCDTVLARSPLQQSGQNAAHCTVAHVTGRWPHYDNLSHLHYV